MDQMKFYTKGLLLKLELFFVGFVPKEVRAKDSFLVLTRHSDFKVWWGKMLRRVLTFKDG